MRQDVHIHPLFLCSNPPVLNATTSSTDASWNANGTVTVIPTGGSTPTLIQGIPFHLTHCNSYRFECRILWCNSNEDAYGCICFSECISSASLNATVSSTDVTASGANDGSATVHQLAALPPYTYDWQPAGGSGATASNLPGGIYDVTISTMVADDTYSTSDHCRTFRIDCRMGTTVSTCGKCREYRLADFQTEETAPYVYTGDPATG